MKDGFDWIVENNQKIGRDQEAEKNKKKLRQIIANLLRKGTSAEIVSECTMVPLEEVLEIEAGLLQQA